MLGFRPPRGLRGGGRGQDSKPQAWFVVWWGLRSPGDGVTVAAWVGRCQAVGDWGAVCLSALDAGLGRGRAHQHRWSLTGGYRLGSAHLGWLDAVSVASLTRQCDGRHHARRATLESTPTLVSAT